MSEEKCKLLLNDKNKCCALYYTADTSKGMELPYCEDNINCYFKQLQAAKEENEKLKDKCDNCPIVDVVGVQKEVLNTLTQQNKQMREALEKLKEYCAKKDSIQWFDYDVIEVIINEALGVYDE